MKVNKIFKYLVFVFICSFPLLVNAKTATIIGDEVGFRSGAGTGNSIINYLYKGYIVSLNDNNIIKGSGCPSGWYSVTYNQKQGYVCSSFVNINNDNSNRTAITDCEKEMQNAGFPSGYWDGLCSMKTKYPNWKFNAIDTSLDWSNAVERESACGKSLIQTSNVEYLDNSCSSTDGSFKAASQKAVAYYMDPRNWLSERYVFQFESLNYENYFGDSNYQSGIKNVISSSSFYKYHLDKGLDLSSVITESGRNTISPIFLASRIKQELGNGTTRENLYGGQYNGYDNEYYGYYNFFNFGVTSTCNNQYGTSYCGLSYAKRAGWNTPQLAISGAANSLKNKYLDAGQFTVYFQKYNVNATNKTSLFQNQYMTNVAAPSSESLTIYNAYKSINLLSNNFVFYIPVYYNMSNEIVNSSSGANENSNMGEGDYSSTIINSGYKLIENYVYGININSNINEIKSKLNENGNAVILDSDGNEKNDGVIGTGFIIRISNSSVSKDYKVVIKGDTSGDGKINALDLLQVQKNILGAYNLSDATFKAGDTSGDGKINALDLLQVQKSILGTYNIEQ